MLPQILTGKRSPAQPDKSASDAEKASAHRMVKIMSWGGIVLFIGLVIVITGKKYLRNEMLELIGGLVILAGTFIMGYALFSTMWSSTMTSRDSSAKKAQTQPELDAGLPLKSMPEPAPSVTDRTTQLMDASEAKAAEKETHREPIP